MNEVRSTNMEQEKQFQLSIIEFRQLKLYFIVYTIVRSLIHSVSQYVHCMLIKCFALTQTTGANCTRRRRRCYSIA